MTSEDHTLKVKSQVDPKLLYVGSHVIGEAKSTSDTVKRHTHKSSGNPSRSDGGHDLATISAAKSVYPRFSVPGVLSQFRGTLLIQPAHDHLFAKT